MTGFEIIEVYMSHTNTMCVRFKVGFHDYTVYADELLAAVDSVREEIRGINARTT